MSDYVIKPKTVEIAISTPNTVNGQGIIRCFNNSASVGSVSVIDETPGTIAVVTTANTVVGTSTTFPANFQAGQNVLLGSNATGGYFNATIGTITDNTHMTFTANAAYANAAAKIYTLPANTSIASYGELLIKKRTVDLVVGSSGVLATAIAITG